MIQAKEKIFEYYANYLTDCISEIRFLDKDNLKQYLTTHLNLFYSQCLDDHILPDINRRCNYLADQNAELMLARVEIEEQLLSSKSALREGKYIDTGWLARVNYAFRIKGVQIQNNNNELRKLGEIKKADNIKKSNDENRAMLDFIKNDLTEKVGKESAKQFFIEAREKCGISKN